MFYVRAFFVCRVPGFRAWALDFEGSQTWGGGGSIGFS